MRDPNPGSSRRGFLKRTAAAAAAGALAPAAATAAAEQTLPTVKLGPHAVTRLIVGGNPVYGHSHFNRHLSRYMTDWHTPERVLELLRRCEEVGINTWQNSYAERTLQDLDRYRDAGGKMHWLCLGKPDWDRHPERIAEAAKRKPIGIAPHGALAERLHRQNRLDFLTDLLKRIRDQGVLVGLSAHNPALIELAEEKGWDVDYYMCCLYYLTRPREEFQKLLGKDLPLGEIYLPSDPPRAFEVVRSTRKPCLVYKVLAAGRRVGSDGEVRRCFETALQNIKPTDAMIVGMYQQLGDQVGQNAAIVRELCARGQ
ncbi:MAG TPA: twin-arginine translocation signal domain-containing protein [Gemmataceae bacterium]